MISNLFIVANNQLKIEKTNEYLVSDVHSTRGFFVYEDELGMASGKPEKITEVSSEETELDEIQAHDVLRTRNQSL